MKILHYIGNEYPLGTPGRFTDLLKAFEEDGHKNTILMQDVPILRAALERRDIPYTLNNLSFLNTMFRMRFHKKILTKSAPNIVLRYNNRHDESLDIIEDLYDGPIRNLKDIYVPVVQPDASIKKMDREETMTPESDTVIGVFCPETPSLDGLEILITSICRQNNFTLWIALDPALSETVQNVAKQHNFDEKIRLFDVTIPRGAFYKGCDLIVVPKGGIDSDISYLEAMALGTPAISCNARHLDYAVDCDLEILSNVSAEDLRKKILTLADDEAMRTRLGEQQRQVFESNHSPAQGLQKILAHL